MLYFLADRRSTTVDRKQVPSHIQKFRRHAATQYRDVWPQHQATIRASWQIV